MPSRQWSDPNSKYKYGFNGKDKDEDINVNGGSYDFGARIYDSRLGRWLSLDPMMKEFAFESNYAYVSNSPIIYLDVKGKFKVTPAIAKSYPQLSNVIKNLSSYVNNNSELKTELLSITGADQKQLDLIFKNNSSSPIINVTEMPVGILGQSNGLNMTNGDGNVQASVSLDKTFLDKMEGILKDPNSKAEDKKAAILAITMLVVHEGTHVLYAQAQGGTTDANKFDDKGDDIGTQLEKKVYKTGLLSVADEKVGEIKDDKNKVNEFALEASKKVVNDSSVSNELKSPVPTTK